MKMPSTYISLLLLCAFMLIFYYTHKNAAHNTRPVSVRPMVNSNKPLVKKTLPAEATDVYLNKNQHNGDKQEQIRISENGFSFFTNVIAKLVPALD